MEDSIQSIGDADEILSRPSKEDIAAAARIEGDVLILGASGKMGPTLARLVRRASNEAGVERTVYAASRFSNDAPRQALTAAGIQTVVCDAASRESLAQIPDCPNVLYLVGRKFGSSTEPHLTWATNVYAPSIAVQRFQSSRVVVLSTANVYPFTPTGGRGAKEADELEPVGEYAQTAVGRERMIEYFSSQLGTKTAILRLSYAIDLRYGVLRDIAEQLVAGTPIDLTTGYANVIWQGDANSAIFRALETTSNPPAIFNLSGPAISIRDTAEQLAEILGVQPRFKNAEAPTALLVDIERCTQTFGVPETSLKSMIEQTADWVRSGGDSLHLPTHYEQRRGTF